MGVPELDTSIMRLHPKLLKMEQDVDMTLFHLDRWNMDFKDKSNVEKGITVTVVLKRKILSEMMTTYLPSVLLLMITFATTFFKSFFFEAALSVNLTTMLVMTTIFISAMEKLPLTSYPKMIDIWLIFCQLVPFTEVLLLRVLPSGSGHIIAERLYLHIWLMGFDFSLHFLFQVILLTAMEHMRPNYNEDEACSRADAKNEKWMSGLKALGMKI